MFTFSLSALAHIGRQDLEWELLLKYARDDVHNFKTDRSEYIYTEGVSFQIENTKPDMVRLNFSGLRTCL